VISVTNPTRYASVVTIRVRGGNTQQMQLPPGGTSSLAVSENGTGENIKSTDRKI
jgi:hypothetical protein